MSHNVPSLVAILSQMEEDGRTYKLATIDEIRAAIAAGADVNEGESKQGESVLWFACRRAYGAAALRALIAAGMNVRQGAPLVERAVFRDTASVRLLLEAGADANAADNFNLTPLVAAVSCDEVDWWEEDEVEDNTEIVRMLLAAGADVNARNIWGDSPLLEAAEGGHIDALRLLMEYGADLYATDKQGSNALMKAAEGRQNAAAAISFFLALGFDVNGRDAKGRTPLMNAVLREREKSVHALLAAGADKHACDNEGKTALDHAIEEEDEQMQALLKEPSC